MKPIPDEVRRFVERQAPEFVAALSAAKQENRPFLSLTLESFEDDMALLYACLWYAHARRVPVLLQTPADA